MPARGAAWLAIAAVVAALVLAPPGLGGAGFIGVGEVLGGDVAVLRDGVWATVDEGTDIRGEETLRTGTEPARLRVRGGLLSLAPGTRVVLGRDTTVLEQGAVLYEGDAVRTVELGAVLVRGRGVFRAELSPSARVGVYRGGVAISDGESERSMGAYLQVDLTEGRAGEPVALRYVAEDPWDARLLSAAIAVDRQVDRTAASLRSVYGTQLQPASFYRDFIVVDDVLAEALPQLSPIARDRAFGPPAETLIAVIVTRLLVERAGLAVGEATADIAVHRRAGATWGLILRRHDLRADDFLAAADTALRSRAIAVEEGEAEPIRQDPGAGGSGPADGPTAPPGGSTPPADEQPDDDGSQPDDGDGDGGPGDDGGDGEGDGDGDGDGDDGDTVDDLVEELPLPEPPGVDEALDRAGDVAGDVMRQLPRPEDPRGARDDG